MKKCLKKFELCEIGCCVYVKHLYFGFPPQDIRQALRQAKIYFILVFLLTCGLLSFCSASRPLYWHSGCFPVTNLKIKHGKDIVWFISFSHTHLNWQFVKRNGKCHGACPVLPFTSSSSFPPRPTHTPPFQSHFPRGQWGRHSRARATAGLCFRGKRANRTILVFLAPKPFAVLLCLQHLNIA